MDGFLLKTFKRLKKEIPRRFKDLKTLTDELIVKFSEEEVDSVEPEVYLHALIMACDTRSTRVMEIALDAFHYLLEHGQVGESFKTESEQYKDKTPIGLVIESVCKCADEFDENVQVQVIKALLTAITSLNCEVHGANLLLSVRACFHINLMSKNPVIKVTAKAALTQMIDVINQRMEINDQRGTIKPPVERGDSADDVSDKSVTDTVFGRPLVPQDHSPTDPALSTNDTSEGLEGGNLVNGEPVAPQDDSFPSVYQRDAYLLFRALCKLSMKGVSEDAQTAINDSVMLQNKILSLELILNLLQNCGPAFRNGEKFIYAVRSYLCVSLLSNCTSQVAQVTGLSLQIFLSLLANFKQHLKSEVEVFVSRIFIGILESENSTFDHKIKVLEVFHNLCKEASAQTEIFINYDCDLEATNLFSRMVTAFAKIAKNPTGSNNARIAVDFMTSTNRKNQAEDLMLRTKGLEGLVFVLKSLMTSANLQQTMAGVEDKELSNNGRSDGIAAEKSGRDDLEVDINHANLSEPSTHGIAITPTIGGASANAGETRANIVEAYDKKQKLQEEIETGILRFNLSPMKGVKYLVSQGHLTLNAKSVANFLHVYQDKLDKTAVGDLLGREKEYENGFCYAVLNEYVESMDFSELLFDNAIRYFLSGFRLPGEAQKIDRIMEKFAEKYYIQHKDEFASADMAFILAFSTIMLQTNLHNPAIKDDKRMTKEQFIKQNKGISSDGELSDQLLSDIYDRIAAEPISINEDKKVVKKEESPSFVVFQSATDRKKKDAFNHERKEMLRASEAMIRQIKRKNSTYVTTPANSSANAKTEEMYVKPMFEIVWPPVIGVISQLLETSEDTSIVDYCIHALHYSIILSCRLDCTTAKNTFAHALSKFTALDAIREMKMKNIACIRLLLTIAISEGEYLDENWNPILQSVSLLARLLLFANGAHTDDLFFADTSSLGSASSDSLKAPNRRMTRFMTGGAGSSGHSGSVSSAGGSNHNHGYGSGVGTDPLTKLFVGPSKAEVNRQVEEANAELVSRAIDPVQIDRVFLHSTALSASSVVHFVQCLCDVSILEITTGSAMNSFRGRENVFDASAPRIFSLQKLVEVADYNMSSRGRVEWANIWKLLANHFSSVGTNENSALAMFAIDSLKQLSIKFLQKDELSNFNFQRLFLKPFELIVSNSQNDDIKDLVLRCLDIMIRACANNIRSGWRSIFGIFEVAAMQKNPEVSKIAFEIIERLMTNQFTLLIYDFVELMNCLVVFVSCPHTALSLKALKYLEKCAEHLSTGAVLPAAHAQHAASDVMDLSWESSRASEARNQVGEDSSIFRLWWPLLLGLSTRVADHRLQVRTEALETLRRTLMTYGTIFSPQTWSVIFKGVLFPIIDSAKSDDNLFIEQSNQLFKEQWIDSMAVSVFSTYSELFLKYQENDEVVPIFNDLLQVFSSCICQDNLPLSNMSVRILKELLTSVGNANSHNLKEMKAFRRQHIDLITRMLKNTLVKTLIFDYSELGKISVGAALKGNAHITSNITELLESLGAASFHGNNHQHPASLLLKRAKSSRGDVQTVLTPYGSGKLLEIVPPVPALDLKSRAKVLLDWGGDLYTTSSTFTTSEYQTASDELNQQHEHEREEKVSIPQLLLTVGTMSVVTSELIKMIGQIWSTFLLSFELEHSESLLMSLEAAHWHSFLFNEQHTLRMNLLKHQHHQRASSRKVNNLLEQEVLSLECIIHVIYTLYFHQPLSQSSEHKSSEHALAKYSKRESEELSRRYLQRFTTLVFQRYLEGETLPAASAQVLNLDKEVEDEDEGFAGNHQELLNLKALRHEAYLSPMLMLLSNIEKFTDEKFAENQRWLVQWLNKLILCENVKIRTVLVKIFQRHVRPKFS